MIFVQETDLVFVGGDLTVNSLQTAYLKGWFPWPEEGLPLMWFSPDPRGVLDFIDIYISKSVKKTWKKHQWTVTYNQNFPQVIEACALVARQGQAGTWILPEMRAAYSQLHISGWAQSVEVWNLQGQLVGGLYGVRSPYYFSAESMFFLESGASKFALWSLAQKLASEGLNWMDIQMLTPTTESLGGKLISKKKFLKRILAL